MASVKWNLALKITVSCALLSYVFLQLDLASLKPLLHKLPFILGCGGIVGLGGLALVTSRWQALIKIATEKSIPFRKLFSYTLEGALYNNLLPGAIGGDIVRARYLNLNHDIPLKTAAKISIGERTVGLCATLALILVFTPFTENYKVLGEKLTYLLVVLGSCLSIVLYVATKKNVISQKKVFILILGLALLAQLCDVGILWFYLFNQGFNVDIFSLISIVGISYLAAAIPISLGGVGVREGVLIYLLTLTGVSSAAASLAALLLLCTRLINSLIGAIIHIKKSA